MPPKPKTYFGFVEAAILHLKEAPGSSRQAIAKYIKQEFGKEDASSLKRALKKGVAEKKLEQVFPSPFRAVLSPSLPAS